MTTGFHERDENWNLTFCEESEISIINSNTAVGVIAQIISPNVGIYTHRKFSNHATVANFELHPKHLIRPTIQTRLELRLKLTEGATET